MRALSLHSLRRQIGVVFEESFLFSDSVRANIAYGRPDATDAEIEAAARAAAAHDFITELPRGYDSIVGERGLSLSGGQRQRIALARALLIDPRILILDDATSAIDATVEESIHDALRVLMAGRTTVLVAHRLSTLRLAERIVVLDRGRVVEDGTHDELVERSPAYRELVSGLADEDADDPVQPLVVETSGTTAAAWAGNGNGRRVRPAGVRSPSARRPSGPAWAALVAGGSAWPRPRNWCSRSRPCRRCATSRPSTSTSSPGPSPASVCAGCSVTSGCRCWSACCWWCSTRWPGWPGPCWSRPGSTRASRPGPRPCCSSRRRSSCSWCWPTWSTRRPRRS